MDGAKDDIKNKNMDFMASGSLEGLRNRTSQMFYYRATCLPDFFGCLLGAFARLPTRSPFINSSSHTEKKSAHRDENLR